VKGEKKREREVSEIRRHLPQMLLILRLRKVQISHRLLSCKPTQQFTSQVQQQLL